MGPKEDAFFSRRERRFFDCQVAGLEVVEAVHGFRRGWGSPIPGCVVFQKGPARDPESGRAAKCIHAALHRVMDGVIADLDLIPVDFVVVNVPAEGN